jgi:hypothetical protein
MSKNSRRVPIAGRRDQPQGRYQAAGSEIAHRRSFLVVQIDDLARLTTPNVTSHARIAVNEHHILPFTRNQLDDSSSPRR